MLPLNNRENAFRFTVPILTIVILFVVLELFARLYASVFSLPRTHYDYRKQQPEPYVDAAYFSKEFVDESFRQPGGWKYPKNTRLIIPNDYHGTHFNILDGKRSTDFQPDRHENAVYLFGGSTIYNSEVPDSLTVASQLQLLFNKHYPGKYIVENYGTTTVTTVQQLERLKTLSSFRHDDIVVFYDGVNDIYQSIFYANPEETMIQRNRRSAKELSFINRAMLYLSNRSRLIQLFFDPINRSEPEHLSDAAFANRLLDSMKSRFKKAIKEAHDYSIKNNASFFHYLQPHLYSDKVFSKYEKNLCQNYYIVPKGIEKSFSMGRPVLQNATMELAEGINSIDLTDILNERPQNEEYFLDSVHVNHMANEIIAKHIFSSIRNIVGDTSINRSKDNAEQGAAPGRTTLHPRLRKRYVRVPLLPKQPVCDGYKKTRKQQGIQEIPERDSKRIQG